MSNVVNKISGLLEVKFERYIACVFLQANIGSINISLVQISVRVI